MWLTICVPSNPGWEWLGGVKLSVSHCSDQVGRGDREITALAVWRPSHGPILANPRNSEITTSYILSQIRILCKPFPATWLILQPSQAHLIVCIYFGACSSALYVLIALALLCLTNKAHSCYLWKHEFPLHIHMTTGSYHQIHSTYDNYVHEIQSDYVTTILCSSTYVQIQNIDST